VTKPYRMRELVARMRAVLRRSPPERQAPGQPEVLKVGSSSTPNAMRPTSAARRLCCRSKSSSCLSSSWPTRAGC
jgi:DNA-binding response OmpR family regulator